MITQRRLEDLIRERVPLGRLSTQGFYALRCPLCADYKERAGFKFEGGAVGYNCFNCGARARHKEGEGRLSRRLRCVLNALGISDDELNAVVSASFFRPGARAVISLSDLKKVDTTTPPVNLPPKTFPLGGTPEFLDYQQKLVNYLVRRKVDLDRYCFFFSLEARFLNRVIIPFYRSGSLIFWQARGIEEGMTPRYDSAPVSRNAVLFNFDQLYTSSPLPLFVVEGVFDALPFDSIAILGSALNDAKVELLLRSRRRLIFVIDKDRSGRSLAERALQLGWEITFAPDGAHDVNEAVQRFGRSWTAYQLMQNVRRGTEAQLAISMRCK